MTLASEKPIAAEHLATVTPQQWRAFFGAFAKAQGLEPGKMLGGDVVERDGRQVIMMPFFAMAKEWITWEEEFYNQNIFCPVDWTSWREEIHKDWRPSDATEAAMSLVLFIRRNRFCEGALASDIYAGRVHYSMKLLIEAYGSLAGAG